MGDSVSDFQESHIITGEPNQWLSTIEIVIEIRARQEPAIYRDQVSLRWLAVIEANLYRAARPPNSFNLTQHFRQRATRIEYIDDTDFQVLQPRDR